jgi:hypothetical protein
MSARREIEPDLAESKIGPIEFLTENGFSIFRRWEIEGTSDPDRGEYEFSVRDPDGSERLICVEISHELVTQIELHTHLRIRLSSSFWIYCAERHLAAYLSEHDENPPDGKLRVGTLTPDDWNLSIRWEGPES